MSKIYIKLFNIYFIRKIKAKYKKKKEIKKLNKIYNYIKY
jgi:hypothetical protein